MSESYIVRASSSLECINKLLKGSQGETTVIYGLLWIRLSVMKVILKGSSEGRIGTTKVFSKVNNI